MRSGSTSFLGSVLAPCEICEMSGKDVVYMRVCSTFLLDFPYLYAFFTRIYHAQVLCRHSKSLRAPKHPIRNPAISVLVKQLARLALLLEMNTFFLHSHSKLELHAVLTLIYLGQDLNTFSSLSRTLQAITAITISSPRSFSNYSP